MHYRIASRYCSRPNFLLRRATETTPQQNVKMVDLGSIIPAASLSYSTGCQSSCYRYTNRMIAQTSQSEQSVQPVHYTVQCTPSVSQSHGHSPSTLQPERAFASCFSIARPFGLPRGIRLKQKLIANIFLLTFPFHKMCSHVCVCINGQSFCSTVYHALIFPTKVVVFFHCKIFQSNFHTSSLSCWNFFSPSAKLTGKVCKSLFVLTILVS